MERAFAPAPKQKLEFDKKYILIDNDITTGGNCQRICTNFTQSRRALN